MFPTYPLLESTSDLFEATPMSAPFSIPCTTPSTSGDFPTKHQCKPPLLLTPPEEQKDDKNNNSPATPLTFTKELLKFPCVKLSKSFADHSIESITSTTPMTTKAVKDCNLVTTPPGRSSLKHSIDVILSKNKEIPCTKLHPSPSLMLTPPTSPQCFGSSRSHLVIEENLMKILERVIHKMNTVPVFKCLSYEIKSQLLEASWMSLLLLGTFEVGFPLEPFIGNLNLTNNLTTDDVSALQKIKMTLEKLREFVVDSSELYLLQLIVLFNPSKYCFNRLI